MRHQRLQGTIGVKYQQVVSEREQMDGVASNINGVCATSKRKASASLESMSASSAGPKGRITNVTTDLGRCKTSPPSRHVKRSSQNRKSTTYYVAGFYGRSLRTGCQNWFCWRCCLQPMWSVSEFLWLIGSTKDFGWPLLSFQESDSRTGAHASVAGHSLVG